MREFSIDCGKCNTRMTLPAPGPSVEAVCPSCGAPIIAAVFPALFNEAPAGVKPEPILISDDSSCFFHPAKKAVVPCDGCGRFLCALCDVEFNGRHLCPACIESGATKGKMEELKTEATYYDRLAIFLCLAPLLIFYFTLITAPIAMYVAIKYWNKQETAMPRGKWRFVVAIILSALEMIAWAGGITALILRA